MKRNLRSHMTVVHGMEKPFTCSACGESFVWQLEMVTHKRKCAGKNRKEGNIDAGELCMFNVLNQSDNKSLFILSKWVIKTVVAFSIKLLLP